MVYARNSRLLVWATVLLSLTGSSLPALELIWPTPNPAFARGQEAAYFVQPTQSGTVESALFGCFRNSGTRFHEGLDLKPVLPRRRGEATDPIYAILDGKVTHISEVAGNSSYGRYVVIEHTGLTPAIYSLYAHLADMAENLKEGQTVRAGQILGTMGRSAGGYSIPPDRAHLHLEIGLRLSDNFQTWYDREGFGSPNQHGNFNGMNLVGFDPLRFFETYRAGRMLMPADYISREPAALLLRVSSQEEPWFLKQYPALRIGGTLPEDLAGWEVSFTAYGLPKRFKPLSRKEAESLGKRGSIRLLAYDRDLLNSFGCRKMLEFSGSTPGLGRDLRRTLELLFNLR